MNSSEIGTIIGCSIGAIGLVVSLMAKANSYLKKISDSYEILKKKSEDMSQDIIKLSSTKVGRDELKEYFKSSRDELKEYFEISLKSLNDAIARIESFMDKITVISVKRDD